MEEKIVKINISELKPHPENEKIYGTDEDVKSLQQSILENGLRNHIKINENNVIVSGHRRWQAFKNLVAEGYKQFENIPCQVLHFNNLEDELECLVSENDTSTQRHKTIEQETRELIVYKEIESIRAKKRMSLGGKGGINKNEEGTPKSADVISGETREIIYQKHGDKYNVKSAHEVDRRIKAVEKIDALKKEGHSDNAELILNILNKGKVSQAYDLANNIEQLSENMIQSIKNGETSVNKAIQSIKSKKTSSSTPKNKVKQFNTEIHQSKICADSLKSHLNELISTTSEFPIFLYYPEELISVIKATAKQLQNNLKYIESLKEMNNLELIHMIEPIIKLDFWENFSCFVTENSSCYTLKDEVIFTILRSLALITDTYCWMDENEDGYYYWEYNINKFLLNFAKKFDVQENEDIIKNLIDLYEQFNKMITEIDDLTSRELKFFNECNIPHLINMFYYFTSLERPDISFKDILIDFLKSNEKKEYENDEIDSDVYDVIYTDVNVEARTDILQNYVDDYIDRIDDESDNNERLC